jgi:hypothetical protein
LVWVNFKTKRPAPWPEPFQKHLGLAWALGLLNRGLYIKTWAALIALLMYVHPQSLP